MLYRQLGNTDLKVSTVSFGAWAIGGTWGTVNDAESMEALNTAIDNGVNFVDTADVYGDGRSEKLIAQLLKERSETIHVATKLGRRVSPHVAEGFTKETLTSFIDRSLLNLQVERIDLIQLHCPPTEVYYKPEVFGILDEFVEQGKLRYYGVSIEKLDEGFKALEYPNVKSVQVIFNAFRQRPAEKFLAQCKAQGVGVIVRLPLSSGLLTGKMTKDTKFEEDDHRFFNRNGEAFDKGETFSGVDYNLALELVDELRPLVPEGWTMAQWALRWILMNEGVSCTIPGAKRKQQALDNVKAADLPAISDEIMSKVAALYDQKLKQHVHNLW